MHEVYRQFRSVLDEYDDPERIAVGEMHFFDWALLRLAAVAWTAPAVERAVNSLEVALPEGAVAHLRAQQPRRGANGPATV